MSAGLESWLARLGEHCGMKECNCPYEYKDNIGDLYGIGDGSGMGADVDTAGMPRA